MIENDYRTPSIEKPLNGILNNIFYYRLLIVFFLLCFVAVGIYVTCSAHLTADLFKNISVILTCGSVTIGIFYLILNYEHNYKKSKIDRIIIKKTLAFNIAFDWHKPVIVEYLKVTKKIYTKHKHLIDEGRSREFEEVIENDEPAKAALVSILNFLDSVATGVEHEIFDEKFIKDSFKSIFKNYFNYYWFYISYRRRINNQQTMWISFTTLAEKWIKEENKSNKV